MERLRPKLRERLKMLTYTAKPPFNFFEPDYLAIGIEVNIAIKNPEVWQAYKNILLYTCKLKAEYVQLHTPRS